MEESKVVKLEGLKIGQTFVHPWIEKVFEKEKGDDIGFATEAIDPDGFCHVALLLDYDVETYPRFIFAYYDQKSKRERIVDTKFNFGWTFEWKGSFYKL